MENYVNCHSHTSASFLDAIITIPQLFKRVIELGQNVVAITDHGVMSNMHQAYKEYKKYKAAGTDIRFIPGNEIYFVEDLLDQKAKRRHLVLLASSEIGYKNLLRITAAGFENSVTVMGREFPRVDAAILRKYNEGLFALSACGGSVIASNIFAGDMEKAKLAASLFKDIFGSRFYMELQPHDLERDTFNQSFLNSQLKAIAEELDIGMVATCDSHYLTKKHEKYHDMILSIGYKKSLDDPTRHRYASFDACLVCNGKKVFPEESTTQCYACYGQGGSIRQCAEFYLKSEKEIYDFFAKRYSPEFSQSLINNTRKIADLCECPDYMEPYGNRLPTFPWEDEPDSEKFLKWLGSKKAELKSLKRDHAYLRFKMTENFGKYCKDFEKDKKKQYWNRIVLEFETLEKQDFSSYMLIVADYVNWAKKNDIPVGPGRVSLGGSLIAFLLGIHMADPIKYGLLFERFHNKEKRSAPDIDLDFAQAGRERVIDYCRKKYGSDKVALISNILKLTPKLIIKDLARSLNLGGDKATAFKIATEITADIPDTVKVDDKIIKIDTIEKALQFSKKLQALVQQYPEILDYATNLVGLPRSFSTHAAGIIISDVSLNEYVPLRSDNSGAMIVQYDKNTCEELGLIKMDFLGLETLDVIKETTELSLNIGLDIPRPEDIPEGDSATYKCIQAGNTVGVFQLSGSLTPICKALKPTCVEDIALINALGRPSCSPRERADFVNRRFKKTKIEYQHPLLEPILKHTMGISVYEEDLLRIGQHVAKWDLAEADSLRKLTKAKESGAALAEILEKKFVKDSMKNSGLSKQEAVDMWEKTIVPFSKYGFNLSHSIFYSMISYQTAYYKTHAPGAFLCALLNSETRGAKADKAEQIDVIKKELKKYKIKIDTCDINLSKQYYTLKDKSTLVTGLGALKGLGDKALDAIIANQPYKSFEDFLYRTPSTCVNKSVIVALAKAGAFDSLGISRKYAHDNYAEIRQQMLKVVKRKEFVELQDKKNAERSYDGYEQEIDMSEEIYQRLETPSEEVLKEEWEIKQKLMYEKEVLGEYISGSADILFPGFFKDGIYAQPFSKIINLPNNAGFPTEGIVSNIKEFITKSGPSKGKARGILTIENLKGETVEASIWPDMFVKVKERIKEGLPIRGQFKVNEFNGNKTLILVNLEAVYSS